jgi:ubiquinone/menaquinone biosynthesis C-methylase UbiE
MLEKGQAKLGTKSASGCHIEWKVGSAEDLSAVPDESIDLVVSG